MTQFLRMENFPKIYLEFRAYFQITTVGISYTN